MKNRAASILLKRLIITILVTLLAAGPAGAGPCLIKQIATTDSATDPKGNAKGQVVWTAKPPGKTNPAVFLYTPTAAGSPAGVRQISADLGDYGCYNPQINALGQVVWEQNILYESQLYRQIFSFTPGSGSSQDTLLQLTNPPNNNTDPKINDHGIVVFAANDVIDPTTKESYICFYNGSYTKLGFGRGIDRPLQPQINNLGMVVWVGPPPEPESLMYREIYYSNNGVGYERLTTDQSTCNNPQINSRGEIVWQGYKTGKQQIYLRTGGVNQVITSNTQVKSKPRINNRGQVAWAEGESYAAIALYLQGAITYIYPASGLPSLNNYGQVAWSNGTKIFVYRYDGSTVQVTESEDTSVKGQPEINDRGQIIWKGTALYPLLEAIYVGVINAFIGMELILLD